MQSTEDNHIKVACRVRPTSTKESSQGTRQCIHTGEHNEIVINSKPEPRTFTFDFVADQNASQDDVFRNIGEPITSSCIQGYNGTILCYGQTGSGKTYTIFGPDANTSKDTTGCTTHCGLVPRALDYIWQHISREKDSSTAEKSFSCRCSFYEIYQEKVFDLLDSAGGSIGGLSVREDATRGVYVEGCTEEEVCSPADANRVLSVGYRNRHVGETAMNRESSRSHAVFQLIIDTTEEKNGVRTCRTAKFSQIDLAGSERQKNTNATGERLKEASQINKSLSALGNVINALADISGHGTRRHVHYRDSKLTFLLRDSLGGNSKTVLVATVSPADVCFAETLSTLKFAQRAKSIKNSAVVNEETSGTVLALRNEILALKAKLNEVEQQGVLDISCSAMDDVVASHQAEDTFENGGLLDLIREIKNATGLLQQTTEEQKKSLSFDEAIQSFKMKLKFREREIASLKQRVAGGDLTFEERVREEVESVRREMHAEMEEFKGKELEKIHNKYSGMSKQDKERGKLAFGEVLTVCERLSHMADVCTTSVVMNSGQNATHSAVESELILKLKQDLEEAQSRATCLEASLQSSREEFEEKTRLLENGVAERDLTISTLIAETERRSEELNMLRGAMQQTDEDVKRAQESAEAARVDQYNKMMKDNMVLLQRGRQLEQVLSERQKQFEETESVLSRTRGDMEKMSAECLATKGKLADCVESLRIAESRIVKSDSEKCAVNEELRHRNREIETLRRDIEKMQFDLDNSREDADSLYTQAETLMVDIEELKGVNAESASKVLQLETEVDKLRCDMLTESERRQTAETNVQNAEERIVACSESIASLTKELSEAVESRIQIEGKLREIEKEYNQMKCSCLSKDVEIKNLKVENNDAITSARELQEECSKYTLQLHQLTENDEVQRNQIEELRDQVEIARKQCDIMEQCIEDLSEENKVLKSEKDAIVALLTSKEDIISNMEQQLKHSKEDLLTKTKEFAEVSKSHTDMQHQQQESSIRYMELQAEIEAVKLRESALGVERDNLRLERDEIKQKFESIRSAINSMSGIHEKANEETKLSSETHDLGVSCSIKMLQQALSDKDSELSLVRDKLREYKETVIQLQKETSENRIELETLIKTLSHEKIKLADENKIYEAKVNSLQEELDRTLVQLSERARAAEIALQQKVEKDIELKEYMNKGNGDAERLEMEAQSQMKERLSDMESANDVLRKDLASRDSEILRLSQQLSSNIDKCHSLESQLSEVNKENARLCGHQNTKQKIQQHMQLKKNIEEQMASLKLLQEQLVKVSHERDMALEESARLKSLLAAKNATGKSTRKVLGDKGAEVNVNQSSIRPPETL